MNGSAESAIFLIFLVIMPLGLLASLVAMVIRSIRNKAGLKKAAEKKGWRYETGAPDHTLSLALQDTLFSLRQGDHRLRHIVTNGSSGFQAAEYHYHNRTAHAESRRGGTYALGIVIGKKPGPDVWFSPRINSPLGRIPEFAAGDALEVPEEKEWTWVNTPSAAALRDREISVDALRKIKSVMISGDVLFFFGETLIFSRKAILTIDRAMELEKILKEFSTLL